MPKEKKHELGRTLMLLLQDFQMRLDRDLELRGIRAIARKHRLVFMHLDRHGASRAVDLARAAGVRPQSMMKVVHELEDQSLVVRSDDPADSRAKLVTFTTKGQKLIDDLSQSTEAVWAQYADLVGERDLERTLGGLSRLLQRAREE